MRLGEYQELVCVKKVDFGIYLSTSSASEERVLLPAKQIPDGVKQGDKLKVFVYKDSNDRLIATTNEPKLTLGGLSVLTVKEVDYILNKVIDDPHIAVHIQSYPDRLFGNIDVIINLFILKNRYPVNQNISCQLCGLNALDFQSKLVGI